MNPLCSLRYLIRTMLNELGAIAAGYGTLELDGEAVRVHTGNCHCRKQIDRAVAPRPERAGLVWSESSSVKRAAVSTVDCRRVQKRRPVALELRKPNAGAGGFIEKCGRGCRWLMQPS
jgi:hypothetical protein